MDWVWEYYEVRDAQRARTGHPTRFASTRELMVRDWDHLRGGRREFWTVRDLRELTYGFDDWIQVFIDAELLAARRYLCRARAGKAAWTLIADYTPWTIARQKELLGKAAELPRSWKPHQFVRSIDKAAQDLDHNPFLMCAELGAAMRHSYNVRRLASPLLRMLTWELAVVAEVPHAELAAEVNRSQSWVAKQVRERREILGAREPAERLRVERERLLRESPGLRPVAVTS